MNIVAHNLIAMNAQRQLGIQTNYKVKTTEKLSSGYKINRAADDAAGLAISEKMRRQIRGLNQAAQNIQDGVSYVQVADGALNEVHDILQRMNELSVKAANGTNNEEDRSYIQQEMSMLTEECDRILKETEFNSQKIWCASYVPYVTGIPRELKIYNENIDVNGNITMGGIIWGTDRYSWNDIDPNMYDSSTGKFNSGNYKIEVPAVAFDIVKDEYVENGNKITLEFNVSQEGKLTSISRKCDWSADTNGITMDGVLYQWTELEDITHNKSFDPQTVEAGYWGFNTYNGTHIWFEIPGDAEDLADVINGINGTQLDHLRWETQVSFIETDFAVGVLYGSQAAMFDTPTLQVTNATRDLVSSKYYLYADNDGVWTENENGDFLGKETWEQLGWINTEGEFLPPHDSTNHFYYEQPFSLYQPDNHAAVTGDFWHYTTGTEGYNSERIPGLDVQFTVMEEASKQGVINGINGVVIQADIKTPSVAMANVGSTSGKVNLSNVSTELSFDFHKDMDRDFDVENAEIGSGIILVDNSKGEIYVDVSNGGNTTRFTATETYVDSKNKVESLLSGKGGTFALHFTDDSGNTVEVNYKVSQLTTAERRDIADGYKTLEDFVDDVLEDILGGNGSGDKEISLSANGFAKQSLGHQRNGVSHMGWANSTNNKAAYANFNTKISYTRQLNIQAGAEAGQHIEIQYDVLNAMILGLVNVNVFSEMEANRAIGQIKSAMQIVSDQRSLFGVYQNRLEHAILVDENIAENTMAAESRIRDADMAQEAMKNSMQNIIMQTGQAMLAQANKSKAGIINLLQQ